MSFTYQKGNRVAKIVEVTIGNFYTEYYLDGRLVNKVAYNDIVLAESEADLYINEGTNQPTFLKENV